MHPALARAGDIVCVASGAGQGPLSWMIRRATGSGFSHAQLVLRTGHASSLGFAVLEVGWQVREALACDALSLREFVIWRPPAPDGVGTLVAHDALRLLRALEARGETTYPWWKLPAYALGRTAAERLLRAGPRQVCSVMSIYPWVARGLDLYAWDDDAGDYERLDSAAEVRTVTPADIQRNAIERGWVRVYETPDCPKGV